MRFGDLPVVFISYDEPNRDANWARLSKQNIANGPIWVHGVTGFDAAHKAACAAALGRTPKATHFFTVDGDTTIFDWVWESSYEGVIEAIDGPLTELRQSNNATFSWRSINSINGLAYGNGGLKLWSVEFVQQMQTHEAVPAEDSVTPVVDFCWDKNYLQMAAIAGVTRIDGSAYQAWRAGFREGVKMLLHNGKVIPLHENHINLRHNLTLHRFLQWATLGEDTAFGLYAIHGALTGFVYAHIDDLPIRLVLDYERLASLFEDVPANQAALLDEIQKLRARVSKRLSFAIPRLGPNQSETLKMLMTHKKLSIYERETWDWIRHHDCR